MTSLQPLGKIYKLEMENFKSYKGFHSVGPFKGFTAIIGPNGAGKSNLMDAIGFVLGVRTGQLRGVRLKDLIYFNNSEMEQDVSTTSVSLIYQASDGANTRFTRRITSAGNSEYSINNSILTWAEYKKELESLGFLIKARNFMVFQSDIESVALKSPKDFTCLIEQISGSEEYKGDYEQFEKAKEVALEKQRLAEYKKKMMVKEMIEKKKQKEEAERYLKLQNELKSVKKEYFLWQLLHLKIDLDRTVKDLELDGKKRQELIQEQGDFENNAREKGRKQNECLENIVQRETKITEATNKLYNYKHKQLKLEEEMRCLNSKIELGQRKGQDKHAAYVDMLESVFQNLSQQIQELEQQDRGVGCQSYSRIQPEDGKQTAELQKEKELLDWKLSFYTETLKDLKKKSQQLQVKESELTSQKDQMNARLGGIEATLEKDMKYSASLKEKLEKMQRKHHDFKKIYENLMLQIGQVESQLSKLKTGWENKRLSQSVEEALKGEMDGVRGRLSNFFKPTEKKYNLAVTAAMGKFMDAIVVDNENTEKKCIEFLKVHKHPMQTFIPLKPVPLRPIMENLHKLGGAAKLVSDMIDHEELYKDAVCLAVGNTLVCDDLTVAKKLICSDEGSEVLSVVTVDGTLLTKCGTMTIMTVGTSGEIEARSKKEFDKKLEELNIKKKELESLGSPIDMDLTESETSLEISQLEMKIQNAVAEKELTSYKLSNLEKEKNEIITPQLQKLDDVIKERKADLHKVLVKRSNILSQIWISHGVTSAHEYEKIRDKNAQNAEDHKLYLRSRLRDLSMKMEREQSQLKLRSKNREASLRVLQRDLERAKSNENEAKLNVENITVEINQLKAAVQGLRSKSTDFGKEIKKFNKSASDVTAKISKLDLGINSKKAQVDLLNWKKQEIVKKCKLEQISVPTKDTDIGMNDVARNKTEKGFKQKVAELISTIETITPNLKALDEYEALVGKENDLNRNFEAAMKDAKEKENRFISVRMKRYNLFMEAFCHIEKKIGQIYKQLTKSSTHPMGGSALVTLENSEDPFLGGINYSAMPPTKTFLEMEKLSGGEKTIAALALLFTIHSYKPSPFYVLDEVDAALDNSNVAKVAGFIRSKSCEGAMCSQDTDGGRCFQSIVISLQHKFFTKAEALVGVYKDCGEGSSKALMWDLTKYSKS